MTGFLDGLLNPDPNKVPSPKSLEARRRIADALMMRGADTSPVGHWSQGAARVADALIGGAEGMVYDRQERAATRGAREAFDKIFGGAAPAPATDSGGWGAPKPAPAVAPGPTPAPAAPSAPGTYEARVQAVESPNGATNPQSGAAGFYQFMPKTAHGLAQQTQWGRGLSQDQVLAAIQADRAKQDELMKLYTAQSDSTLTTAGLPANDANRYALHWFGPGGGPSLLRADPAMPTADWVRSVRWDGASPDAVISQNRLDRFKTVGELRAHIEKSMGGGSPQAAAAAPPAAPQMAPGTPTPFNPQGLDIRAATAALANPWLPEGQRAVLGAMIGQAMKPNEPIFKEVNGQIVRIDPRTGQAASIYGQPAPRPGSRTLSADEVQRAGLPAGTVAQVDQTGKITVVDKGRGDAGPFQGTAMDAQVRNMLLRGDPASPEYAAAYAHAAEPKTSFDAASGQMVTIKPDMSWARPPSGQRPGAAAIPPQPAAPSSLAPGAAPAAAAPVQPGQPTISSQPVPGLPPKPPTEGQAATRRTIDRLANAESAMAAFETLGLSGRGRFLENIPLGNYAQTPDYQRYVQARDDFINARLRRESGAAISASEYADADRQFFPQPGDSQAVVEQKRRARQVIIDSMAKNEAGSGYSPPVIAPMPAASPQPAAPQQGGSLPVMQTPDEARAKLKPGDQFKTPDGRTLRVPGGR